MVMVYNITYYGRIQGGKHCDWIEQGIKMIIFVIETPQHIDFMTREGSYKYISSFMFITVCLSHQP